MIGVIIRTIISRFLILLLLILSVIPVLIIICLPERIRFKCWPLFWLINWFYRAALWFVIVPIKVIGKENIPSEPAIFVANHQSALDIPLVGVLAGSYPHVWLARSELMQTWLLRIILPRLAVIVDVDSPRNAMRSLLKVLNMINGNKLHLMIFPEGQRFVDDEVHEFFGGFVILAKKTGRPVVPVCILGVNKVYPPHTFMVKWHPITVVVGKQFKIQEDEDDEGFKKRVYDWFVQQVSKAKG